MYFQNSFIDESLFYIYFIYLVHGSNTRNLKILYLFNLYLNQSDCQNYNDYFKDFHYVQILMKNDPSFHGFLLDSRLESRRVLSQTLKLLKKDSNAK